MTNKLLDSGRLKIDIYNQYDLIENLKYSICPLCSHTRKNSKQKCAKLDWQSGIGTCSHCGESFQLHTYKSRYEQKKTYTRPVFNNKTELQDNVVKYFEKRKISQNTLKFLQITDGKAWMPPSKSIKNKKGATRQTIQFNYFKENELVNIKFRTSNKEFRTSANAEKCLYNIDNCWLSEEIIITEGEIDTASYVEAGFVYASSIPYGANAKGNLNMEFLDNSIEVFENKKKIYLVLDNDTAGQNSQKEIIRRLGAERCFIVDLSDCNDPNEYLVKYGKERLRQTIENAKIVPLENVTSLNSESERAELLDFFTNGLNEGLKTGIKEFDLVFSTLFGFNILMTGTPTHGKSEFADFYMIKLSLLHGIKWAVVSPENSPVVIHKAKMFKKIFGFTPTPEMAKTDEYIKVLDFIGEHFHFINFDKGLNLEKSIGKIKELIVRKGVKGFILDPFNKIRYTGEVLAITGNRTNDYTSAYLNLLNDFSKEYDLLGILVAHPVKKNKKDDGELPIIDFYDVKGGGEFFDMMPFGLSIHRNFSKDYVTVKVLKCKFNHLGTNNAEVYFKWSFANGRYFPIKNKEGFIEFEEAPEYDNDNDSYFLDKKQFFEEINSNTNFENETNILPTVTDDLPF
jgi:twinkle protein